MMRTSLAPGVLLLALVGLSSIALAGSPADMVALRGPAAAPTAGLPDLDGVEAPGAAMTDGPSALERIGAALLAATLAVGDALGAALGAVGDVALLVGHGLADLGGLLASAASWAGVQIAVGALALGRALAFLGVHALDGALWAGARLADGIAWTVVAIGHGLADLGRGLAAMWPSDPKHQAIVGGVAAGTAAAGGAAWYVRPWRYLALLAPLYTRIARADLLDHPVRVRLVERVREHPGIHVSEVARELSLPWGTMLHHLDKLERGGLLVSTDAGSRRCLFLPGQVPGEQRRILPALENETARAIAEYYAGNPGASQKTASDVLGLSPALVSWHVKRLESAGVITRVRDGRQVRIDVTNDAMTALA